MPLYLSICESIKKHEASSYLPCWDVNNLHHLSMSQKLPVNNIELIKYTSQIKEDFIKKKHNEESDEGYFLEVAVQYLEKLHELYTDLSFLPGRLKIEKIEKLVAKLYDKAEYVILVLKQTLNHGLDLKKVIKLIKFNNFFQI